MTGSLISRVLNAVGQHNKMAHLPIVVRQFLENITFLNFITTIKKANQKYVKDHRYLTGFLVQNMMLKPSVSRLCSQNSRNSFTHAGRNKIILLLGGIKTKILIPEAAVPKGLWLLLRKPMFVCCLKMNLFTFPKGSIHACQHSIWKKIYAQEV